MTPLALMDEEWASILKDDILIIRELFSTDEENDPQNSIKNFSRYIAQSNNDHFYQLSLLEELCKCRPRKKEFIKSLIQCVYSAFPEEKEEIDRNIPFRESGILWGLLNDKEKQLTNSLDSSLFSAIVLDDVEMLISIFANNPSIDANYKVKLEKESFIIFVLGKYVSIEMIELSCFMGSIKCFKYLLLNNCNIIKKYY